MSEFKSFYTKGDRKVNTWCRWNDRIDPYGRGCAHDCSYCYAKSLLDFRKMWNPKDPAVADPEKIRKLISKLPADKVVRVGGMTDPFQPVERKHRVTYEMLKAFRDFGVEYLLVTKSDMVADDDYLEVMDKRLAHIQVTITTTDDDLARTYENAPPPTRRIKAVEKLQSLGYDVAVRLSPFIPEYVDIDRINGIKCDKILIEFLKVSPWIKKWFHIDYTPYSLKCGGYEHLQLEDKIKWVDRIVGFREKTVGEFVPEHHAYFSRNVNANPDDCCNLRTTKQIHQDMEPTDKCKKERKDIPIDLLLLNKGQVSWLPKNPRRWTAAGVQRMVDSLNEDPDFLEDRPPLVVPYGDKFVVFASNLRVEGEKRRKQRMSLPCIVYYPETDEDRETVKRRATKDNGHMGLWDVDELANEVWGDAKTLQAYGVDGVIDPEEQVKKVLKDQEVIARTPFTKVLGEEHNYILLYFDNDVDWLQALTLFNVEPAKALPTKKDGEQSLAFQKRIGVGRVLKGADAINNILEQFKQ